MKLNEWLIEDWFILSSGRRSWPHYSARMEAILSLLRAVICRLSAIWYHMSAAICRRAFIHEPELILYPESLCSYCEKNCVESIMVWCFYHALFLFSTDLLTFLRHQFAVCYHWSAVCYHFSAVCYHWSAVCCHLSSFGCLKPKSVGNCCQTSIFYHKTKIYYPRRIS